MLPSYVVNMDEFNQMLSSCLSSGDISLIKSIRLDFQEVELHVHHTDISKTFDFLIPSNSLVYGVEVIESSFKAGNYCSLFIHEDSRFYKVFDIPLYDGFNGMALQKPLSTLQAKKISVQYYNENCSTKNVCVRVRYLRGDLWLIM